MANKTSMMLFYILICIPFISCIYSDKSLFLDNKVFKGATERVWNAPFLAALEKGKWFMCPATIIAESWLTSTVPCLESVKNVSRDMKVRTGSSFLLKGGKIHNISRYFKHPKFTRLKGIFAPLNNIALIETSPGMGLNKKENRYYVPLIGANYLPEFGQELTIFGWGLRNDNGGLSNVIQKATVLTVDVLTCNNILSAAKSMIGPGMFCASAAARAPCGGDLDGPALFNGTLTGIISYTVNGFKKCGHTTLPAIYTHVGKYVAWIKTYVKLP